MSQVTVDLYYGTAIKPNHLIEDIETYLDKHKATTGYLASNVLTGCKEFEADKESFSIRVEIKSASLGVLVHLSYCKLTGTFGKRYYFVTGYNKVSDYIVDINLQLDVVNSYQTLLLSNEFKNVKMKRKMKDRWKLYNQTYYRIYDKCDEGLGSVCTQVDFTQPLHSDTCYLVNRTIKDSDDTKVTHSINVNQIFVDNTDSYYDVTKDKIDDLALGNLRETSSPYYNRRYLGYTDLNHFMKFHLNLDGQSEFDVICQAFYVHVPQTTTNARLYLGTYENKYFTPLRIIDLGNPTNSFTLTDISSDAGAVISVKKIAVTYQKVLTLNEPYYYTDLLTTDYTSYGSTGSSVSIKLPSIATLDRYSDALINIMEIPLVPGYWAINYIPGLGIVTTDEVIGETYTLDLNPSTSEPRHYTKTINKGVRTRNITMESKLYGSYVRDHMIQYDTFSLPIQPEYYNGYIQSLSTSILKSVDLSGDLSIKCNSIIPSSYNSNVLTCSRNNNKVIYNSEYLNYLRNGYNYDEKAASLTKIKNGVNTAVSIGSTVVSGAAKGAMGTLGTFGLISSATSAATTLTNSIISGIENDRALAQKRLELINSAPTMTGSNSGALFKALNGGTIAPYYVTLKPSDEVLNSIWNLFYFYGYADNTTVDTLKLTKTREYFDYYQGDAESNYSTDIRCQRAVQALSEGITIEHHYNDTWLCEGNLYENWETSI